ncbi:MAG: hypothetical protein KDI01_01485 [Halioglobus sp.]|nr:hypothetical protein [Halioglobus sp.]
MSPESSRMFRFAAAFNWGVALGLFLIPAPFLGLLSVSPTPEQSLWVQQFAGLVLFFGIGYYQASVDLEKMAPMIRLAVWAKWGVVLIALLNVLTGDISWQFMIPASVDGVFAVLFVQALRSMAKC